MTSCSAAARTARDASDRETAGVTCARVTCYFLVGLQPWACVGVLAHRGSALAAGGPETLQHLGGGRSPCANRWPPPCRRPSCSALRAAHDSPRAGRICELPNPVQASERPSPRHRRRRCSTHSVGGPEAATAGKFEVAIQARAECVICLTLQACRFVSRAGMCARLPGKTVIGRGSFIAP